MSTRRRPQRFSTDDDEPRRAVKTSGRVAWSGTSRRAKLIAIAMAALIAVVTFTIVSRAWTHGAPPPKGPGPVEVKLIAVPMPH